MFIYIPLIFGLVILMLIFYRYFFFTVIVYGNSMYPTLTHTDRLLAIRRLSDKWIKNGRIAVIYPWGNHIILGYENRNEFFYIKRVIGISEDEIITYLHDFPSFLQDMYASIYDEDGKMVWHIPANHCFLQGDNKSTEDDSKIWGPAPVEKILGIIVINLSKKKLYL